MTKEYIKQAFAEAEKDQQQQEITKIKKIVQAHLEKIESLTGQRKKLDEELKVLKEILDDLKAGRLDKIEEYIEKDEKAKQYTLIIIKKVEKEFIPMYPWRSPWIVEWVQPQPISINPNWAVTTSSGNSMYLCTTGTSVSNFTSGTYNTSSGNSITL